MLVDSHCHLDFKDFAADLDDVVSRAEGVGVGTMVTIGTRLDAFPQVRAIAERYGIIYCSVGVHPHEAAESDVDVGRLVALAEHPKVVGIGETGLDYYYDHSPRERQRAVFRVHMDAARRTGLPLIVHTREADEDMADLLAEGAADDGRLSGVLHCFSSGRRLAETAIELGFYISLSGIVTFKKAEELRAIARDLPEDRLLVETDSPYLAPVPHRGKRNEPAFVAHTARLLADLRGVPPEAFARATTANFFRLFRKARAPDPGRRVPGAPGA